MLSRFKVLLLTLTTLAIPLVGCDESGATPNVTAAEPTESPAAAAEEPKPSVGARQRPKRPGTVVADPFDLDLPPVDDTFEPGQQLWALHPGVDTAGWTLGQVRYVEPGGRFRIEVDSGKKHELPTSFVRAAAPADGLVPGLPVVVQAAGAARFGRVQSISKDHLRVRYAVDHETLAAGTFTPTDVLRLDRHQLEPGAPVIFSSGRSFFIGVLGAATGKQAFVICGDLVELGRTEVTVLDTSKLHKPGDRVIAVPADAATCEALEGEVIEMKDGGLRYAVALAEGGEIMAPYGLVAPHPSTPRPTPPAP